MKKSPQRDGTAESLGETRKCGDKIKPRSVPQGRQIFFSQSVPFQYGFPLAIKAPFLMMTFLVMDVPGSRVDLRNSYAESSVFFLPFKEIMPNLVVYPFG